MLHRKYFQGTLRKGIRSLFPLPAEEILELWVNQQKRLSKIYKYYQIPSLVKKRGTNSAGRPWTDPLNEFAKDYSYDKGTCPFEDDLVSRSSLLSIPPTLTDEICDHVVAEFQKAAKKYM